VNGVVGVGIFFAPSQIAASAAGWGSVAVIALTGAALIPVAAAFANTGRRFDEDGGPVVFARAAFGEFPAFLVGWITYVSAIASTTAVTSGLTAAVAPMLGLQPGIPMRAAAVLLVLALAVVCALGLRLSAGVWTGLTVLKLVPLAALLAAFVATRFAVSTTPAPPTPQLSWLRAGLLATFAFQGFEITPLIAGRVTNPERSIPMALYGCIFSVSALYILLQAACVASLPALAASATPLTDAAAALGGPGLRWLVALGTSISALGISFGFVVMTPWYLATLARNAGPLPFSLDRISERGVPLRALAITVVLVSVLLLSGGTLSQLFALSGTTVLLQYGVTALSLWTLSRHGLRGFTPRDAWPALPALLMALALVSGAQAREAVVASVAIVLGLLLRRLGR
jgi:basic amino acid/polyamine antiporter, APA family